MLCQVQITFQTKEVMDIRRRNSGDNMYWQMNDIYCPKCTENSDQGRLALWE